MTQPLTTESLSTLFLKLENNGHGVAYSNHIEKLQYLLLQVCEADKITLFDFSAIFELNNSFRGWKITDITILNKLPADVLVVFTGVSALDDVSKQLLSTFLGTAHNPVLFIERKIFRKRLKSSFTSWRLSSGFCWPVGFELDLDTEAFKTNAHYYLC